MIALSGMENGQGNGTAATNKGSRKPAAMPFMFGQSRYYPFRCWSCGQEVTRQHRPNKDGLMECSVPKEKPKRDKK